MKKLISSFLILACMAGYAYAVDYNLKKITPAIQEALDGRRDRYSTLEKFKNEDVIGEDRDGYVVNLTGDADADGVVSAENRDRKIIYSAIVKQNNLPEMEIHTVGRVFAETQRSKAKDGQMIQLDTGKWVKK